MPSPSRCIAAVATAIGLLILGGCNVDQSVSGAKWAGVYTCLVDDRSEIWDGERGRGHNYFDLDGDHSDPAVSIRMKVTPSQILVQQAFLGKATKAVTTFDIVAAEQDPQKYPTLVGFSRKTAPFAHPEIISLMYDQSSGKYGFSMISSFYVTPALRDGESQVGVDLDLAHCVRKESPAD